MSKNIQNRLLENRNVLITGGSQGFGLSLAKFLFNHGANIAVCGRSKENLKIVKNELSKIKNRNQIVEVVVADITKPKEVKELENQITSSMGFIEILINNAGKIGPIGNFLENDLKNWQHTFETNVFGSACVIQKFLPSMLENQRGRIIQLSGGGASNPLRGMTSYAASKSAIVRFIETLALEYANTGVYFNSIAPGMLKTQLLNEMLKAGPEKVGSTLFDKASLKDKELSDSTRIACELVLFLCLDESKGITGKLISAEWDNWQLWPNYLKDLLGSDVYTIRRVVGKDRNFDWGDN